MILIVLLLAMWPFHAKKPVPPTADQIEAGYAEKNGGCDKQGDVWYFYGPDNVVGFSSLSCSKAYHNWFFTPVPKAVKVRDI